MDLQAMVQVIALIDENYFAQVARHRICARGRIQVLGSVCHQTKATNGLVAQGARHVGIHLAHVALCHVHGVPCHVEILKTVDAKDALLNSLVVVQNQEVILVITHV